VLSAFAIAQVGRADEAADTKEPRARDVALGDIVRANLERSYVVYPIGVTGLDPLVFEADLVPNFSVLPHSWHVALFLTPKIVLRMFAENSLPVKTPSYMPRLTTFFWFSDLGSKPTAYFSAMLAHHSNGQSGPFYDSNGAHNHENGSFDTNHVELAAYPVFWKHPFFGWSSFTFEWHPRFLEDAELRSTYGNTRLHVAATIYASVGDFASDLSAGLSAILGEMQKPTNAATVFARFPLAVRYAIHPSTIDVGLYAAYYQGQDYYNIWYDRFISVFQVGVSGNLSTGLDFDPKSGRSSIE
jgi:hypothetical protein